MQALLSFEKAPPFAAPLRFFLTGPLFAALAGLILLLTGEAAFASRWTPEALALTHLITLGFMLQIMLGALIQILPVVAGANLAQPLRIARLVHFGLSLGVLGLPRELRCEGAWLLRSAAALLGASVLVFLVAAGMSLRGVPTTSPTIRGVKLALVGLSGVVVLGVLLALALANGWAWPLMVLADLHAGWGLGAWAGTLLAAVSYVVVPMFQLTPGYPARPSWWFPVALLVGLFGWSLGVLFDQSWLVRVCQMLVGAAGIAFAILTLRLQLKRRRARADATYRYWQLGLGASIFALFMLCTAAVWPAGPEYRWWTPLFGVLLLAGGFVPFIIGMLYKIVPFLAWMHLQSLGQGKVAAPAMNKLLPDTATQRQLWAYAAAVALLLLAVFWPEWLARPAGLLFAVACGWLGFNLLSAYRRYRAHLRVIEEKTAAA